MIGIELRGAPFFLDDEAVGWVERTLASMSEDEKVAQLFTLISYTGDAAALGRIAADVRPGGIMFRPMPARDVLAGVRALQSASRIPMLVAANLERGGDGIAREGTCVGSPMQVAATGNDLNATRLGAACGREGAALGVNWAFGPVVDVDANFRNPITNTRTFGSDPAVVARMGAAYVRAIQAEGVAAAPKHFPGDGVDERDHHLVTSSNDLSAEAWDASFGAIYRACIGAGARSIMVGHIMLPAWSRRLRPGVRDAELLPASLAPELVTGLLRERLGFNGLVVTDATTMAGMTIAMPRAELVPRAIAAGCDMFLFTRNLDEDLGYMRRGIADGVIGPQRLEEALTRILALKASLGLHRLTGHAPDDRDDEVPAVVGCAEHRSWAADVANGSVTLVKDTAGALPLDPVRHRRVLFHDLHAGEGFYDSSDHGADGLLVELLEAEGFVVERFAPTFGIEGDLSPTSATAERYDLIVYLARIATRSNQTVVRIEWAQPMGSNVPAWVRSVPTVFISVENPYHLLDVPQVPVYINAYGSSDATVRAVVDKLLGRSPFTGRSPVDPFCGRWDARR